MKEDWGGNYKVESFRHSSVEGAVSNLYLERGAVFRAFFVRQYLTITSEAFDIQAGSFRKRSISAVEKYLQPLEAGDPSGLSWRAAMRMGISCAANPKNQAVSSAFIRPGERRRFRKSDRSIFIVLSLLEFICVVSLNAINLPNAKAKNPILLSNT